MKKFLKIIVSFICTLSMIIPSLGIMPVITAYGDIPAQELSKNVNTSLAATVYYGKNGDEPYAWRVIGYAGNGAASVSEALTLFAPRNIGAVTQFSYGNNIYKDSVLKERVDEIANKLSEQEREVIVKKTLKHSSYIADGEDHIAGDWDLKDILLWPLTTNEARSLNKSFLKNIDGSWWLCSPSPGGKNSDENVAAYVNFSGFVKGEGESVTMNKFGVRPAFYLDLASIILTSAAEGGKKSGPLGPNALIRFAENTGNEYKLTVLDKSRDFKVLWAKYDSSSRSVEVEYTGATAYDKDSAPNEYISAVIKDLGGKG